jgi:hypothetical protein
MFLFKLNNKRLFARINHIFLFIISHKRLSNFYGGLAKICEAVELAKVLLCALFKAIFE